MENGEAIAEAIYIFAREMADLVVFFIDIPRKGKLDLDKIWTPSIEHLDILVKKLGVPIAVGATFPEGIEPDLRLMLIKKGIAPLLGLSDVLSALNASIIWKVQSEKLLKNKFQKLLSISENSSFQNVINNEAVSKDTLKTFGLRFPKYKKLNLKGLQRINEKLDCPMVLKICSDEVPHKQLMGGVKTNLLTKNRILNAAKLIAKNYDKKFRKEGIGKSLMNKLLNIALKKKIQNIFLEVSVENLIAINLYKRFNFIKVGKRKNYYFQDGKYIDADIMKLVLF